MAYSKFNLGLTGSDMEDCSWDAEAEAFCVDRFSDPVAPIDRGKCGCGAPAKGHANGLKFCETCADLYRECTVCGHGGTHGDFQHLFDDEVVELCPACGRTNTMKVVMYDII